MLKKIFKNALAKIGTRFTLELVTYLCGNKKSECKKYLVQENKFDLFLFVTFM